MVERATAAKTGNDSQILPSNSSGSTPLQWRRLPPVLLPRSAAVSRPSRCDEINMRQQFPCVLPPNPATKIRGYFNRRNPSCWCRLLVPQIVKHPLILTS